MILLRTIRQRYRPRRNCGQNKRKISADKFFKGLFETALGKGEIILQVSFPLPKKGGYEKFRHPASRFALVGVFVADTGKEIRVAVTGASESGVFRAKDMESALKKTGFKAEIYRERQS